MIRNNCEIDEWRQNWITSDDEIIENVLFIRVSRDNVSYHSPVFDESGTNVEDVVEILSMRVNQHFQ